MPRYCPNNDRSFKGLTVEQAIYELMTAPPDNRKKFLPKRPLHLCENLYWYVESSSGELWKVKTYSYPEQPFRKIKPRLEKKTFPPQKIKSISYVCCFDCADVGYFTREQKKRKDILLLYKNLREERQKTDDGPQWYNSYKRMDDGTVVRTKVYGRPQVPHFLYDDKTYHEDKDFCN